MYDVEEAVLGFILSRPHAMDMVVLAGVMPHHFRAVDHRRIYAAMQTVHARGARCGFGQVAAELWLHGEDKIELELLWSLYDDAPISLDLEPFLHEFLDAYWVRTACEALSRLECRQSWEPVEPLRAAVEALGRART